jgi:VIT1/CCC1 family predicted Fe2+/Mn2+ transporter
MSSLDAAKAAYLRNFVFGVEDSLVSTVGLLSGVAIAGMSPKDIFVTGLILIFVEAISMCAGSFLSETSAEEFETRSEKHSGRSLRAALIMFISYFVSGFIPLAPYIVFTGASAFMLSIAVSLGALLILGAVSARLSSTSIRKSALRMAVIGGLAIGAGVLIGGLLG